MGFDNRIAEKALVISTSENKARVRLVGGEACRRCGMAEMGLCRPGGTGMEFDVINAIRANQGDMVTLGLEKNTHTLGYAAAYALPVIGLLSGAITGFLLDERTGIGWLEMAGAGIGLSMSLASSLVCLRKMDGASNMHISRILRDVPDFDQCAPAHAESDDYIRAFSGDKKG